MYQIGLFSQLGKTTVKTLRYYDEVGLLKPELVDEFTGYRYYTSDQLIELHRIVGLRQVGFSIAEIARILNDRDDNELPDLFAKRREQLISEHDHLKDQISRLDHLLREREDESFMDYQAVIKEIPEYIVFSKRMVIPSYDALFEVEPALGKEVAELNPDLACVEPEYCFNIYHDGEYKETDIDIEVCQAVTSFGVGSEESGITFKTVPAITAASVLHRGPYMTLGDAYAYLTKWIDQNNYEIIDNPRESYIDGIWNKDDESQWLTEIQFPVAKK